jgi:hypothetical protein
MLILRYMLGMSVLLATQVMAGEVRSGYFCSGEGTGVWGGKRVELRWQSGFIEADNPSAVTEVVLYADHQPAATFNLHLTAPQLWTGVSGYNSTVTLSLLAIEGGQARFVLNDWKNKNTLGLGSCDTRAPESQP